MVNGVVVAYVEIPALFSTLAMGTFVYGLGRLKFIPLDSVYVSEDAAWFTRMGQGEISGIPLPIVFLLATAAVLALFFASPAPGAMSTRWATTALRRA